MIGEKPEVEGISKAREGAEDTLTELAKAGWTEPVLQFCRDLLDPSLRDRFARLTTRLNQFGMDSFGFSPQALQWAALPAVFLFRKWFRVETFGASRIPNGRVLLIANHSGQVAFDGMMVAIAVLLEHNPPRVVRSMIEKWVPRLPYVNIFMSRAGQIVGTPENCRKLLNNEEAILVFPEGMAGVIKTFDQRYQLQPFGLGFMRLALETNTPIVPVTVIGAEEQAPAFFNFKGLARLLGLPSFPVTPLFPFTPLGFLPLPTKYRIYFGDPMHFTGDANDEDAEIEKQVTVVRSTLQSMLERGLKERKHIFW